MSSLPNELWWNILADAVSREGDLDVVRPSSERLHPFFPGAFPGFGGTNFCSRQLALWKRSNKVALNLVRVSRLWRGLVEPLLYSALYVQHEWRLRMFINNVKTNPKLAEQLRTLVIVSTSCIRGLTEPFDSRLIVQVLNLCHGVTDIAMESYVLVSPLPLLQSLDSSRRLRLLSVVRLMNEEFPAFVGNFNNYSTLQALELSVKDIEGSTLPSLPEHIPFPSLRALILGDLDPLALSVVGKFELPSLRELTISRWKPLVSTPLIPLIRRSYERLEFLNTSIDLLHDRAFYDITRAPPPHLRNLTLDLATSDHSSPPMRFAVKSVFHHVTTLGTCGISAIRPENKVEWVRFLSDRTYMPHLRSVLTDTTIGLAEACLQRNLPLVDLLCSFEEVLEARGVPLKGLANDNLSFIPVEILQKKRLRGQHTLFNHFPYSRSHSHSPCQHQNALQGN